MPRKPGIKRDKTHAALNAAIHRMHQRAQADAALDEKLDIKPIDKKPQSLWQRFCLSASQFFARQV